MAGDRHSCSQDTAAQVRGQGLPSPGANVAGASLALLQAALPAILLLSFGSTSTFWERCSLVSGAGGARALAPPTNEVLSLPGPGPVGPPGGESGNGAQEPMGMSLQENTSAPPPRAGHVAKPCLGVRLSAEGCPSASGSHLASRLRAGTGGLGDAG